MYLGCRFHGHIDNSLMAIAMKYVDVVTYNIYQNEPRSYQYKELMDQKPLMVTEFGVETQSRTIALERKASFSCI